MTDQNHNDHIPEATEIEEETAERRARFSISPGLKFGLLIGTALVVIVGGIVFTASESNAPSQTTRAANLDSTPGGDVQAGSPAYQEAVRRMNEDRANRAEQLGATSIATPEAILQPIEPDPDIETVERPPAEPTDEEPVKKPVVSQPRMLPKPEPAPAPVRVSVAEAQDAPTNVAQASPEEKKENPYISSISQQMTVFAREFTPKAMSAQDVALREDDEQSDTAAGNGTQSERDRNSSGSPDLLFRPGDVLYAETLTSVNSDAASPIMAEVVSGDFKGARLVGEYTTEKGSDRMVVAFKNMTLDDGTVLSVNAYAVDGQTAETAVASDIDRRYVARYAPIIAASFISGYAASASFPGSEVVGTGDTAAVATQAATAQQSLYAGLATAADAVSADILANSPDGPKITLRDGYPIGIMFVDPVEAPVK